MTSDIYFKNVIDLVLFTVVDLEKLRKNVWDEDLISPAGTLYESTRKDSDLALFVVTVPAKDGGQFAEGHRRMLPGGAIGAGESLDQASRRLAWELIGIPHHTKLRQVGIFDDPDRNPNERVISFAYWGMVDFEYLRKFLGGRDRVGLELVSSMAHLRTVEELAIPLEIFDGISRFGGRQAIGAQTGRTHERVPNPIVNGKILELDHDDMVFYAWRKLRHVFNGRMNPFSVLGFNPLTEAFPLSDMQQLAEVCRGERVKRDTFRRQMTSEDSFLRPVGKADSNSELKRPGKPANLYTPDES